MSYNVDTWHEIECTDLAIPFETLNVEARIFPDKRISLRLCEDGYVKGILDTANNNIVLVDSIKVRGAGSSHALEKLKHALKSSTGKLDAVMVWEGGDSVSRLTAVNGEVTYQTVDLVELIKKADGK